MTDPPRHPSRDHIRPRSRGHALSPDNQSVVCRTCNAAFARLQIDGVQLQFSIAETFLRRDAPPDAVFTWTSFFGR